MSTHSVVDKEGARRADLAAIHVAKKALSWTDDTYRDVMFTVVRVRSAALLDFAGRKTLMAHMQACLVQLGIAPTATLGRANKAPWSARQRQVWSLWQQLADAKLVQSRDGNALAAWVKRQTGVDRVEFLTGPQLDLVIDSAKRWLSRKPTNTTTISAKG